MKKILALVLCLALVLSFVAACGTNSGSGDDPNPTEIPEEQKMKYGLHVEEDGTITLNGEAYYAYGTNWHGGFSRLLTNPDLDYDAYFEALANGIPIMRTMMNVFYDVDEWRAVYDDDAYFYAMDKYIAYCEKYHIGLVMSMMWNYANFYVIAGENVADCLGDPNAKGTKIMQDYVRKVVTRYKDSPAVFAWEVGNEGCLAADRGNGTSVQMGDYYRIFAETVREIDDYRLITTGDSMIFECTNALRTTGKWSPDDTPEQRVETMALYNQDPIDCICVHFYGHDTYQRVQLVPTDMEIAKNMNKGFIVGEYGAGYSEWDKLNNKEWSTQEFEDNWVGIVDELVADNVQIALQWDFGRCAELSDEWSIELGFVNGLYQNEYQYNKIKEVNEKFVADGKNKSADYWEKATPLVYGREGFKLDHAVINRSTNDADLLKGLPVFSLTNWDGTMKTKEGKAYTNRSNISTELSDGTIGVVFAVKTVGEENGLATMPNRLTLSKLIETKPNTEYTVKFTYKATYGEGNSSLDGGGKLVIVANKNENDKELIADGQWHTDTYTFVTDKSVKPTVTIGSTSTKTGAHVGTSIFISDFELYEGKLN